jgi:hypothetical protein
LAEAKYKVITEGIAEIKKILSKPPANLANYVEYVANVEL